MGSGAVLRAGGVKMGEPKQRLYGKTLHREDRYEFKVNSGADGIEFQGQVVIYFVNGKFDRADVPYFRDTELLLQAVAAHVREIEASYEGW